MSSARDRVQWIFAAYSSRSTAVRGAAATRRWTRCCRTATSRHAIGNVALSRVFTPSSVSASGAFIAAFVRPSRLNVLAGLLTFYLVATG